MTKPKEFIYSGKHSNSRKFMSVGIDPSAPLSVFLDLITSLTTDGMGMFCTVRRYDNKKQLDIKMTTMELPREGQKSARQKSLRHIEEVLDSHKTPISKETIAHQT